MEKLSALVSVSWVAEQLRSSSKNLRVVDASWHLPMHKRDPLKEYRQEHIPSALFFDIPKCSAASVPGGSIKLNFTLPTPDKFAEYLANLGIDNETHVVLYENNAKFGFFSAPRVWWMFRVFGHDKVSIMQGGLPLWQKDGHDLTDVIPEVDPVKFIPTYKPNLYKSFSDVEVNLETGLFQLMDARPEGRFKGIKPEPRADIVSGHVPNSVNLPFFDLTHEEDGIVMLKSPDALKKTFAKTSLDMTQPIAASCGGGISACVLAFGAYLTGKDDVAIFDGSWEEYYLRTKDKKPENILKE